MIVMAGPDEVRDPAIFWPAEKCVELLDLRKDGRVKPGHDGFRQTLAQHSLPVSSWCDRSV
jgi:hypothetical protein